MLHSFPVMDRFCAPKLHVVLDKLVPKACAFVVEHYGHFLQHRVNLSVLGFTTTYETAGTAEVRGSRVSYQILWAGLWVGS